jgi:hypothetical protein
VTFGRSPFEADGAPFEGRGMTDAVDVEEREENSLST